MLQSPLLKKYCGGPMKTSQGPAIKCWPGKVNYGKKNSPSGKKNPDGTPKQVNDCGEPGRNDK